MEHILKLLQTNKLTRTKALTHVRNLYKRSKYCYADEDESTKTKTLLKSGQPCKIQALDWFNRNEKVTYEGLSNFL